MDNATREALEKSIAHWEENLAHAEAGDFDKVSADAEDCALCAEFSRSFCRDCPISASTGRFACLGTPFFAVCEALDNGNPAVLPSACRDELEFLKSLRPTKKESINA